MRRLRFRVFLTAPSIGNILEKICDDGGKK